MFLFQARENEIIDRIAHPFLFSDSWNRRTDRRLEGPMISLVLKFYGSAFRPFCALIDPGAQQTNLFDSQAFALLRHDEIRLHACHCVYEQTSRAIPRNDCRTQFSTFEGN